MSKMTLHQIYNRNKNNNSNKNSNRNKMRNSWKININNNKTKSNKMRKNRTRNNKTRNNRTNNNSSNNRRRPKNQTRKVLLNPILILLSLLSIDSLTYLNSVPLPFSKYVLLSPLSQHQPHFALTQPNLNKSLQSPASQYL